MKERALLRELAIFRDAHMHGVVDEFRWIPTNLQLADPLTKLMEADELLDALKSGIIRLKPNEKELKSKKGSMKLQFIHSIPETEQIRGRPDRFKAFMAKWLPTKLAIECS